MTKHHGSGSSSNNKCSTSVRVPPTQLWNSDQVVAFPNDHKHSFAWGECCGATTNITMYNKRCFKFCDVSGNQTDVVECLKDAGVKKAVGYNSSDSGDESGDENAGVVSVQVSKSKLAVGLALVLLVSLAAGTL